MRINKVVIEIENADETNATVRLITDPVPNEDDEIEDTPCVLLGSAVWDVVQEYLDSTSDMGTMHVGTLQ